jgi:hypothetical protein
MNTMDDLRDQLEALATEGPNRSADDAFRAVSGAVRGAGRHGPRSRRPALAVAVALVLVAAGLTTWKAWPDQAVRVSTKPTEQLGVVPPALTVPSKAVSEVTIAFGKIWVASSNVVSTETTTLSASTTLRAYDARTGELVATIPTRGGSESLIGVPLEFAVTDHAVWLRTSSQTEIFNGMYDVIYRIDPHEMKASANRYEVSDGPLVGFGDRIAAADSAHLEIVREDGVELGLGSIEQVVQKSPGTPPGTNGLMALHLDASGLWAYHEGYSLIVRVDRTSTSLMSVDELGDHAAPFFDGTPASVSERPMWWVHTFSDGSGSTILVGEDLERSAARAVRVPGNPWDATQIDDHRVLLSGFDTSGLRELPVEDRPTGRLAPDDVIFDTATGASTPAPHLPTFDKTPAVVSTVDDGGTPLIVSWEPIGGDMSTVHFYNVPG